MVGADDQNLWSQALESLPSEQKELLPIDVVEAREFSGQRLLNAVESSQKLANSNSRTISTPRGSIVVREKLDRIAVWIRRFIAIGDTAVQYDPGHAALPWALFRLVLQVFLNDGERASEFVTGLEQVAFLVYDCAVRETLYLDGINKGSDDLQSHLVKLYGGVLRFLIQAWDFFQSGTAKRLLRSIGQNGKDVIALLAPVSRQTNQILTICGRIDAERQLDVRDSVGKLVEFSASSVGWLRQLLDDNQDTMQVFLKASHQETLDRFDTIDTSLSELLERSQIRPKPIPLSMRHALGAVTALNAFQGTYINYDRSKVLDWLSTIPYVQHHLQTHGSMLTGTGNWLFERQAYRDWVDSTNTAMLWFHGAAGQGKTKVMSLVIEQALKKTQKLPQPLFFYCSRAPAEPERAKAGDILRCLIKQISLRYEESERRFPRYVVKEYKDEAKRGFAVSRLSTSKCCEIIAKYAKDCGELFICIDAVDECSSGERYDLFAALQTIITLVSSTNIKILVSSRDDVDAETFLPGNRTLEIGINDDLNRDDIAMYVDAEVARLIKQRRILIKGKPPTEELRSLIAKKLRDGAQGMFRWVSLQLEYLCTLKTVGDIKQRLGRLPKELTKSYDELYNRKLDLYDKEDKDRLEFALTLILIMSDQPSDILFAQLLFFDPQDEESFYDSSNREDVRDELSGHSGTLLNHERDEEANPLLRDTIRLCFNFIVHDSTTSVFRFAHTSVQDYLGTHRAEYTALDRNCARLAEHTLRLLLSKDLPLCHRFVPRPAMDSLEAELNAEADLPVEGSQLAEEDVHNLEPIYMRGPSKNDSLRVTVPRVVLYFEEHLVVFLDGISPEFGNTSPIRELLQELLDSGSGAPWKEIRPYIFLEACEYCNMPLVTAWLEAHPALLKIQEVFPLRRLPLFTAAASDKTEALEYLISKGGNVNTCGSEGIPLLSDVAAQGQVEMMKLLIEKGANVDGRMEGQITRLESLHNGEPIGTPFPQVDKAGNFDFYPLIFAVSYGGMEAVRLLIESGADLHIRTQFGPVVGLAPEGEEGDRIAQLLLDSGVSVDSVNYMGESALTMAASRFDLSRLRILLEAGANLETRSMDGATALLDASQHRGQGFECVKALVAAGADPNALKWSGAGLLAFLGYFGNVETLEFMLPHIRDINTQDWDGDTPLCQAMCENQTEAVRFLLAAGAEITVPAPGPHCAFLPKEERMANYGRDAVLRAADFNKPEMVKLVIEAGNQRDPGGEYAEAATLLGEADRDALERWIQKRREMSPRSGPEFEAMEQKMHEKVVEIEYATFEKHVTAAGRKILYHKHPTRT